MSEGLKLFQDYKKVQLSVEYLERQIAGLEKRTKPVRNLEVHARREWHAWAAENPEEVEAVLHQHTREPIKWNVNTTLAYHEALPSPFE